VASFFAGLIVWITDFIGAIGYPGIFLLMIVEGIITPIPSEFIMPFAGYRSAQGMMNVGVAILVGTAGAAIGNVVAYGIGLKIGRPAIDRYGRFIGLGHEDVEWAERWFARFGDVGVLVGHAIPGVRSIISFPAGIGHMRLRNFVAYSSIGALIWNTVLVLAGFFLLERWIVFAETTENVDLYIVTAVVAGLVGYVYWRKLRARRKSASS